MCATPIYTYFELKMADLEQFFHKSHIVRNYYSSGSFLTWMYLHEAKCFAGMTSLILLELYSPKNKGCFASYIQTS